MPQNLKPDVPTIEKELATTLSKKSLQQSVAVAFWLRAVLAF